MNNFKVGDPIVITNPRLAHFGRAGEIVKATKIMGEPAWTMYVDGAKGLYSYLDTSIAKRVWLDTPDVLTIPRAELPEVVEERGVMVAGGRDFGTFLNAAQHRKTALAQLAVSEFLATREKAEQDAADQHAAILNKRRDELAVEVAKAAGFIDFLDFTYKEHLPSAQAAIKMLIERDGKFQK